MSKGKTVQKLASSIGKVVKKFRGKVRTVPMYSVCTQVYIIYGQCVRSISQVYM